MIENFADKQSLAQAAAKMFANQAQQAIGRHQRFNVALSGGSTPALTYEALAREPFKSQIDWSKMHLFWGDERVVPASDSRSNYANAQKDFLSKIPVPASQIHPIPFHENPEQSAREYEALLKSQFAGQNPPIFDLILLGLGEDGHTASLFPDSPALEERQHWVKTVQKKGDDFARITLTLPVLNATRMALFLVQGTEKKKVLEEIFSDEKSSKPLPAKLIKPQNGALLWLISAN